ncbi:MAG TPA: transglycosylase domain-containing protein [Solirubrobacterales bacterium]|nr:transglycosylase domain-containing protein [Solirubrobacterales bacterium]
MTYRARQRHRRRHRPSKLLLGVVVLLAIGGIAALSGAGYVLSVAASAPALETLKPIDQGTSSVVFAADGSRLGYIQSDEIRTPIPLQRIPESMQAATIAIEDERYYEHGGVDYEGIVRAAFKNLEAGKAVEGGSTITMQLVRNLYVGRERTLERKIREARLAEELEDQHSKRWILQSYLNSVPYGTVDGQTAVGVQAAAQTFFDKPAKDLTLEESALLAGLPQAPSRLNPFQNKRDALERRNKVLSKMAELGYITHARAQEARRAKLGVRRGDLYIKIREPFFFDFVKQQLIDKFGVNTVRKGGLKIYTTIDPKLQTAGRNAIDSTLNYAGDPSSAVVAIDPRTGYIKAMASSSKYKHNQYNLAAQGHRQPGSAFKTFVLTTAVKRGVNPYSTSYVSRPLDLQTRDYGPWKVQTYDQSYSGSMNVARATLKSDNTVYAQLDLDLGPQSVADTAKEMGITTKLDGYPAEGLGGLKRGVSPLEMANAYATLASGGIRNKPIAILRVKFPDGDVEELGKPKRERVFSDAVAYEVTKILKQNVTQGTGTRANINCPSAGKTGTTDNFNDAWYDGFTPHLATAVWVGYPDALKEMRSVHGISVAGGTFPAMIWNKFMQVAKGKNCSDFPRPKSTISWSPFFGKYSKGGTEYSIGGQSYDYGDSTGGGYQGYDPRLYGEPNGSPPADNGGGGAGTAPGNGPGQ